MTGDDNSEKHVWTLASLKIHFDSIINERTKASEEAQKLWRADILSRLDKLNNETGRVKQIQDTYLLKITYDLQHERLVSDVQELKDFRLVVNTKASQASVNLSFAFSVITLILSIVAIAHEFTSP